MAVMFDLSIQELEAVHQVAAVELSPVTVMPASVQALVAPETPHCRLPISLELVPALAAEPMEQLAKRFLVQMAADNSSGCTCANTAHSENIADGLKAGH
jgi:hypothetical protein